MMARKALGFLIPVVLGALVATQWNDIQRYLKIKQMSYGDGHPENVPAAGRASYRHPAGGSDADRQGRSERPVGGTTARDRTGVDPQEPIDGSSPDLQTRS